VAFGEQRPTVATYLTALRGAEGARTQPAALEKRRAQIETWIADESLQIREVELVQQRLDIDAQRTDSPSSPTTRARGGAREGGCLLGEAQRDQELSFDDESDDDDLRVFSGSDLLTSHNDIVDLDWGEIAARTAIDERKGLVFTQTVVIET
jgi:hypothetical protein